MKKVVRMLGLCALVALAFTACKKDDTQKVTFTANVAQTTSDARTHAEYGAYLVWDEGDEIQIFNGAGTEMDFTAQVNPGYLPGVATFTAATTDEINFVKDLQTAKYTAFYPATVVDNQVRMTIPANQEYVEQRSFAPGLYPMFGWNIDGDGNYSNRFQFYSNAGFLNVSFTRLYDSIPQAIDEIVLTSNNPAEDPDPLTGYFIYDKEGNLDSETPFVGNGNQIVMQFPAVDLYYNAATDFTFVLPEGALHSGFTVEVKLGGQVVETYVAQPRPQNTIAAQNYTVMIPMQVPAPPAPIND